MKLPCSPQTLAAFRRIEQFPGCKQYSGPGSGCELGAAVVEGTNCCPKGAAMWSSYEFSVSSGKGGAIDVDGPLMVTISDATFSANEAPRGASLAFTATASVRITNTTIDTPADDASSSTAVQTVATAIDTCFENPCGIGSRCSFKDSSTFCDICANNEIGVDGISCAACQPSTPHPSASGPAHVGHVQEHRI